MRIEMFDRHDVVKGLLSVGFTEDQAEMHGTITGRLVGDVSVIKNDVAELRKDTKNGFAELRKDTKNETEELRRDTAELRKDMNNGFEKVEILIENSCIKLERDLTIRMGGILVVIIGAMFGMFKFFL